MHMETGSTVKQQKHTEACMHVHQEASSEPPTQTNERTNETSKQPTNKQRTNGPRTTKERSQETKNEQRTNQPTTSIHQLTKPTGQPTDEAINQRVNEPANDQASKRTNDNETRPSQPRFVRQLHRVLSVEASCACLSNKPAN